MTNNQHYARRLYNQAICDPDVDSLDWPETEAYLRAEAENLCLDPDAIIEEVEKFLPPTTDQFKTAAEVRGEDYSISLR